MAPEALIIPVNRKAAKKKRKRLSDFPSYPSMAKAGIQVNKSDRE